MDIADHYPHFTPPIPPPSRLVKRGAYMLCLNCNFTSMYCRCSSRPPADKAPEDGPAAASLSARIAERKDWR